MINVTLTITGAELRALREAAEKAFPNELLSRGEITGRFALAGIEATKPLMGEGRKAADARASLFAARAGPEGNKPRRDCW